MRPGAGLRIRLWTACLLSGLAGAGAILVVLYRLSPADPLYNPAGFGIWPWSAASGCVVLALALGFWLDHGVTAHLRGVSRAIASGDPTELGALPAARRWGELSLLAEQVQSLLARQRELGEARLEVEELRSRILGLRLAVETWSWDREAEPLRPLEGPLGALVQALDRHRRSDEELAGEGRSESLALRREIGLALADARDSAEQAERSFVEATALLGTVRELQRLGGELEQELSRVPAAPEPGPAAASDAQRRYREAAAGAIEELVAASRDSVEHLAAGLGRVQEIGQHVQVLANRATLIALNAAVARGGQAAEGEGLSRDLRALAAEVRAVTERAAQLSGDVDREVAAAVDRMRGLRERVADRLDQAPPLADTAASEPAAVHPTEAALRLLERLRQLVQDSAVKGETLSASGERASRAADRLARRLDEESGALERLARRLGASDEDLAGTPERAEEPSPPDVRLLGPEAERRPPGEGAGPGDVEERS